MVIITGKPDTTQDSPAHTPGVNQGNSIGNYEKQPGHLPGGKRTAASATGINPSAHGPIDAQMPNLPPA
jgi:hypothetical protein